MNYHARRKPKKTAVRHPMQPVVWDGKGVIRFQENPIVSFLLDWAQQRGMGLNELVEVSDAQGWTRNDWEHFAQLHGYSISGWGDLSYVRDATYGRAEAKRAALLARQLEDPAGEPPTRTCAHGVAMSAHCMTCISRGDDPRAAPTGSKVQP